MLKQSLDEILLNIHQRMAELARSDAEDARITEESTVVGRNWVSQVALKAFDRLKPHFQSGNRTMNYTLDDSKKTETYLNVTVSRDGSKEFTYQLAVFGSPKGVSIACISERFENGRGTGPETIGCDHLVGEGRDERDVVTDFWDAYYK